MCIVCASANQSYLDTLDTHEWGCSNTATSSGTAEATVASAIGGVGTLDEMAEFLTTGFWGGQEYTWASDVITVNISGLEADAKQVAIWAMEAWEMVANITFELVTFGEDITVDDEYSGAYAYVPNSTDQSYVEGGVELNVNKNWSSEDKTIDSYWFQTYVHEFGHALGLGHQGHYDLSDPGSDLTFSNDSWQLSVMSYYSQNDNDTVDQVFGTVLGPQMVDIIAIQSLYGAPDSSSATSGNTTYGANSNVGNYLDDVFDWFETGDTSNTVDGNSVVYTLYDVGGTDTLDLNFLSDDTELNLNEETFSTIGDLTDIIGISRGTIIENAKTGSGDDRITGNAVDNIIDSGAGNDLIESGAGSDTVYGGDGYDRIYTGSSDDFVFGGSSTSDLRDVVYGGDGNDYLDGGYGNDLLVGGNGDDTLIGGFGVERLEGGSGNDVISGGAYSDLIFGGSGADFINGGFGHDRINGGDGADRFFHLGIADHGSDWIQDYDSQEGDVLMVQNSFSVDDFQVNYAETSDAGADGIDEAFIIYKPTGQILWALVDGGDQDEINIQIGTEIYDIA